MWIWRQASGDLERDGAVLRSGYSGNGPGKNNPAMQAVRDVGPIPQGEYRIGAAFDSLAMGPVVLPLYPVEPVKAFGRSGFFIHGDSIEHPGEASLGCIILPRDAREAIAASKDAQLTVTA